MKYMTWNKQHQNTLKKLIDYHEREWSEDQEAKCELIYSHLVRLYRIKISNSHKNRQVEAQRGKDRRSKK